MYSTTLSWARRMKALPALGLLLFAVLTAATPAFADVAPPDKPPGANPAPGSETTQVRMVAETVLLEVQRRSTHGAEGEVRVQADFLMRNLGPVEERMEVRFPLTFWDGSSDGFYNYPEIRDLRVSVEGGSVGTRRVSLPATREFAAQETVPWAVFPAAFPPGEDVRIRVTYTADGIGDTAFVAFKYVLETGAGWNSTIGTADLIVRLPYEANEQNVIFDEPTGYSQTTPGGVVEGREVRWHYDDLEPTGEYNLVVSLVKPEVWEQALLERERVTRDSQDGEAWGRLAKLYKEMVRFRRWYRQDEGGQELYRLSLEAYEKAVTILPRDPLWHLGFADLLFEHYYWHVYGAEGTDLTEILRAAQELNLAYTLDPDDERILAYLENRLPGVVERIDGGYDFPILTSTPALDSGFFQVIPGTPTPPPTMTVVPVDTVTSQPTEAALATAPPIATPESPRTTIPFCGSAGLVFAATLPRIAFIARRRRPPEPRRKPGDVE